jgi:hypothetical protein
LKAFTADDRPCSRFGRFAGGDAKSSPGLIFGNG